MADFIHPLVCQSEPSRRFAVGLPTSAQEDPQLESAREALAAVQETQTQASVALFLPEASINANVNQDRQNVQFGGAATGANGSSTFMAGGYTLTLTQPILHYDRIIAWQQADQRIAQAEAEFAAADNLRFAQAQQDTLVCGLKETQRSVFWR